VSKPITEEELEELRGTRAIVDGDSVLAVIDRLEAENVELRDQIRKAKIVIENTANEAREIREHYRMHMCLPEVDLAGKIAEGKYYAFVEWPDGSRHNRLVVYGSTEGGWRTGTKVLKAYGPLPEEVK